LSRPRLSERILQQYRPHAADIIKAKGTLVEVHPYYTHSYGEFVPEIVEIDRKLNEIMDGGDR